MNINIYPEKLSDHVQHVEKTVDGVRMRGIRFIFELPKVGGNITFINKINTDENSTITFWSGHYIMIMFSRLILTLSKTIPTIIKQGESTI